MSSQLVNTDNTVNIGYIYGAGVSIADPLGFALRERAVSSDAVLSRLSSPGHVWSGTSWGVVVFGAVFLGLEVASCVGGVSSGLRGGVFGPWTRDSWRCLSVGLGVFSGLRLCLLAWGFVWFLGGDVCVGLA